MCLYVARFADALLVLCHCLKIMQQNQKQSPLGIEEMVLPLIKQNGRFAVTVIIRTVVTVAKNRKGER